MATKKYVSLNKLSVFLDKLKQTFATKTETDANLVTAKQYADDKTSNLLSYTTQSLTDEQRAQARANIEAVSISDIPDAIVDVVELPTTVSDDTVFYRLLTALMVFNQKQDSAWDCYCVDGLPSTGTAVANTTLTSCVGYYNIQDGVAYGYVNNTLSSAFSVPVGWYPLSALLPVVDFSYGGVITNIKDDPKDNAFRTLLEYELYTYKEGLWTSLGSIGSDFYTVDKDGNAWFAGNVFVGGTGLDDTSAKMLATSEYVDNQVILLNEQVLSLVKNSDAKIQSLKTYSDNQDEAILYELNNQLSKKASAETLSKVQTELYKMVSQTTTINGKALNQNITLSASDVGADASGSADNALNEAKVYTDNVKNDLLNGAGGAYDTLKELGDLIDNNTDAIEALKIIAVGKADENHTHNDIYYTESEIDEKFSTKTYTDNALAQKSQVQIITLEEWD